MPDSTDSSITWQHWRINRHNSMGKKWLDASQKDYEGIKLMCSTKARAAPLGPQSANNKAVLLVRRGEKEIPVCRNCMRTHIKASAQKSSTSDYIYRKRRWNGLYCCVTEAGSKWITAENMNYCTGSDQKAHLAQEPSTAMNTQV